MIRLAAIFALSAIAAHPAAAAAPPDTLPVVPAVRSWEPAGGTLLLASAKVAAATPDLEKFAGRLEQELAASGLSADGNAAVSIALDPEGDFANSGEGYRIEIGREVKLTAADHRGLFHASRTLLQLLCQDRSLPQGLIRDAPTSRGRMLMLDVGRKPYPLAVLKDYIRIMAWYKMNELHLHFSDEAFGGSYAAFRIQSEVFPGLAAVDFSYSKQDIRELQDFAASYGVTITPEFDMPGHARCFTNYWPDTMLKGYPNYVDVTNPKTITNLKRLLDEMIPLFDAPDIHIGTDEYRVGDRPDLHEAFRQFINTMNAHVRSHGKNCRIWSGFEHMQGSTEIDPSVTIDMWETDDAKGQIAKGHKIINSNHGRTYIVPGCHYYGISCPGIYQSWEPWMVSGNPAKNPAPGDPHLLGGKLNVWSDQGPSGYTHQEIAVLTLPGIHAFAEKLWGTKGSPDYPSFVVRTAATLPIPGVSLLERLPQENPGDVVLDLPGEQELGDSSSFIPLPLATAARGDLEYPWTLTLELRPTAAATTRGVILSSELAEICGGSAAGSTTEVVTEFADGSKRRGTINTVGPGSVRLAGAPQGKDPFSGYLSHDVSKFSGKSLPTGEWSSLCVVATQGRNVIYLNGEKVLDSNNQMLCPLRWLGSKTGNSFVGKVRNLRVLNRALSPQEIARSAGLEMPENLAENRPASATQAHPNFPATHLTDGDPATRWSSGDGREGVVTVDLGAAKRIGAVKITWEVAYAVTYEIAVSTDGATWQTVFSGEGRQGETLASFPPVSARHVRITGKQPATGYGYSIWELEVHPAKP